jgi:ubiquinone/menaquinone biosynthesis C-methylase UbiE
MSKRELKHFDIIAAKKAYVEDRNIPELLRKQKNLDQNTPEIIELAYDLQAGSYIENVEKNPQQSALYTAELAEILNHHISPNCSLLDIGAGELTTISLVLAKLAQKPSNVFAFDLSWSRIYKGINFAQKNLKHDFHRLNLFVGDISEIPLLDKSVNITTSSHSLEPNGGKLKELLVELFRVTSDKLVLFEPCYEINSKEGKARMDNLGYIKNMDDVVEELGGKIIEKLAIKNISNSLNPTVCFVIKPPPINIQPPRMQNIIFSVPGTNISLQKVDDFYFSTHIGLSYPILKKIPILKSSCAILSTLLLD